MVHPTLTDTVPQTSAASAGVPGAAPEPLSVASAGHPARPAPARPPPPPAGESRPPRGRPLPAPVVLGEYTMDRYLGGGAMGAVFTATHAPSQDRVALKFLHRQFTADPVHLQRFEREAMALRKAAHPHLVRLREVVHTARGPAMVMDLLEGRTLEDIMQRTPALPATRLLRPAGQLAGALDCLHRHGYVHRDLKPANLMVTDEGDLVLIDLGIARPRNSVLTRPGTTVGTPRYMSPEQARGDPVTAASDQFSAAVILHSLLEGRPLSEEKMDVPLLLERAEYRGPPAMTRVTGAIQAVVHRALAPDPLARFPSMVAFHQAFILAVGADDGVGRESSPFELPRPRPGPPIRDTTLAPRPPSIPPVSLSRTGS